MLKNVRRIEKESVLITRQVFRPVFGCDTDPGFCRNADVTRNSSCRAEIHLGLLVRCKAKALRHTNIASVSELPR
jgi:hypothetical protein